MSQNKALSMIGLATKAGKVASGEFCTEKEVKSGRACLVIVADDASDNTKKKFQNMCVLLSGSDLFLQRQRDIGACNGKRIPRNLWWSLMRDSQKVSGSI